MAETLTAFEALGQEEQDLCSELVGQLLDEAQSGGPKSKTSIIRAVLHMTTEETNSLIDLYESWYAGTLMPPDLPRLGLHAAGAEAEAQDVWEQHEHAEQPIATPPRKTISISEALGGQVNDPPEEREGYIPGRIDLASKNFTDTSLREWLKVNGLQEFGGSTQVDTVDMSWNHLTGEGVRILVDFLIEHGVSAKQILLSGNRIHSPDAICRLIEHRLLGVGSPWGLQELDLNDTDLSKAGFGRLLTALRHAILINISALSSSPRPPFCLHAAENQALGDAEEDIEDQRDRKSVV